MPTTLPLLCQSGVHLLISSSMLMVTPTHPPGPWVLSAPTSINWLVPWLPANLLGMVVIAAALLGYFRPRRKTGQ